MTDGTPQKPAADWYPDPSGTGQLRYWDGEQWTQELRAHDQAVAAATEVSAPITATEASAPLAAQVGAQPGDTAVLGEADGYSVGFAGVQGSTSGAPQGGAPAGAQQFAAQQPAHSGQDGFFRSLFDLSFAAERSVTTGFVKVIYVIGIVVSLLSWLGGALMLFVLGGISSAAVSVYGGGGGGGMMVFGVVALLLGWIPGFINIMFLRVGLEFVTAQIRTSQHTAELVRLGRLAAEKE